MRGFGGTVHWTIKTLYISICVERQIWFGDTVQISLDWDYTKLCLQNRAKIINSVIHSFQKIVDMINPNISTTFPSSNHQPKWQRHALISSILHFDHLNTNNKITACSSITLNYNHHYYLLFACFRHKIICIINYFIMYLQQVSVTVFLFPLNTSVKIPYIISKAKKNDKNWHINFVTNEME